MRLIDADALKARCGDWYTEEGPESGFIGTIGRLLDHEPTVGGWISVKDKLPDRNGLYIVYGQTKAMRELLPDNDPIWMCYYRKDRGFYDTELCRGYDFITHWMPLPEPPEEE